MKSDNAEETGDFITQLEDANVISQLNDLVDSEVVSVTSVDMSDDITYELNATVDVDDVEDTESSQNAMIAELEGLGYDVESDGMKFQQDFFFFVSNNFEFH